MTTIIILVFALVALVGFVISLIALVKSIRKPEIYGGKVIAVTALVIIGIFSLISAGLIISLLFVAAHYLSGK